jgi:hypothetical protein
MRPPSKGGLIVLKWINLVLNLIGILTWCPKVKCAGFFPRNNSFEGGNYPV